MTTKVQTAAPSGAKPAKAEIKPDAPQLAELQVVNDIAVAPVAPVAPQVEPAAEPVAPPAPEPAEWPCEIVVRNDSRAAIVCPVSGMFSQPGTQCSVLLHDADHAAAVLRNIRDLAQLQNVSGEVVITGLPDGLVI